MSAIQKRVACSAGRPDPYCSSPRRIFWGRGLPGWCRQRASNGRVRLPRPGAAVRLRRLGPRAAVVTAGERGVWAAYCYPDLVSAAVVTVVDVSGAGDAFLGALALSLSRGTSLPDAVAAAAEPARGHGPHRDPYGLDGRGVVWSLAWRRVFCPGWRAGCGRLCGGRPHPALAMGRNRTGGVV
ncbi:hypothetical protein K1W54_12435 [Micromonospora sp. CPCC 205371]|nr:hypothetical protein [Micromonospora sp. CPCC 205371]